MAMGPVTQVGGTTSVGLPFGAHVPPSRHAASKSSIRGCTADVARRWRMLKLVVVDAAVCINVDMALIMATIGHLILKPVQLLIAQILILLVVDRLGSFSDLLDISLGLFSQVVGLLQFEQNLCLQVQGRRARFTFLIVVLIRTATPTVVASTLHDVSLVDLVGDVDLLGRPLDVLIVQAQALKSFNRVVVPACAFVDRVAHGRTLLHIVPLGRPGVGFHIAIVLVVDEQVLRVIYSSTLLQWSDVVNDGLRSSIDRLIHILHLSRVIIGFRQITGQVFED